MQIVHSPFSHLISIPLQMQQMLNMQKWPEELFCIQNAMTEGTATASRAGSAEPGTDPHHVGNIMMAGSGLGRFRSHVLSHLRSGPLSSFFSPRFPGVRPGLGGGLSGGSDSSVFGIDGSKRFAAGTDGTGGEGIHSATECCGFCLQLTYLLN